MRVQRHVIDRLQKKIKSTKGKELVNPLSTTRRILSLMGALPCSGKSPYRPSLNRKTSNVVYCAILLTITTCNVLWTAIAKKRELDQMDPSNYVQRVCTIETAFLMSTYLIVYILWTDASELEKYINLFAKLQADFQKTTGKPLEFRKETLERVVSLSTLIVIPAFYYALAYFIPYLDRHPAVATPLLYGNTVGFYVVIYWNIITMSIVDALEDIQSEFKQFLQSDKLNADILFQFRLLWLSLRKACDSTGRWRAPLFGYTVCMGLSVLLLYSGLSFLQACLFANALGHIVAGGIYVCVIFLSCRASHEVEEKMKVFVKEILSSISLSSFDRGTQREITMFYLIESARPAVTTFGGMLIVNRHLVLSYFSSILTYIIVMVQFLQKNDNQLN